VPSILLPLVAADLDFIMVEMPLLALVGFLFFENRNSFGVYHDFDSLKVMRGLAIFSKNGEVVGVVDNKFVRCTNYSWKVFIINPNTEIKTSRH
jgi:hypothetical protein